jgi:hypothetical protein
MDVLTLNIEGPATPHEGYPNLGTIDEKVQFYYTNAVMASLDPVAIDVAGTNLIGYHIDSVPYLKMAADNGLGEFDPAYIKLHGDKRLTTLRQNLVQQSKNLKEKFNIDLPYPPKERAGGIRLNPLQLNPPNPTYTPGISPFEIELGASRKTGKNKYEIDYQININPESDTRITRVEAAVGEEIIGVKVGGDLTSGTIIIDLNQEGNGNFKNTALAVKLYAWDQYFNAREWGYVFFPNP